jgi:predicted phosphodiesterase
MFQIMSDIHLDTLYIPHEDLYRTFAINEAIDWIKSVPQTTDILILPGDVHSNHIGRVLEAFAKRWRLVIYVPGNHDYWGQRFKYQWNRFKRIQNKCNNVKILMESIYEDSETGLKFAGTTMWFPYNVESASRQNLMNDFTRIKESDQLFSLNYKARQFLNHVVADAVVTHHAPSMMSVADKDADINVYYVDPMLDNIYQDTSIKMWIHGHTHEPLDYMHPCGVRVVSNPGGYARNLPGFDPGRVYALE